MASFHIRKFHIFIECPECSHKMHVDPHALASTTRIIMCENSECKEFGFAWTLDILTGEGSSERKTLEEHFPQLSRMKDESFRGTDE